MSPNHGSASADFITTHVPDLNAMLVPEQLAAALQITVASLHQMIRQGLVPAPVAFGKKPRWSAPIIAGWIREGCPPQPTGQLYGIPNMP